MNCVDYLFENTAWFDKNLLLGTQETLSYQAVFERSVSLAGFLNQKVGTGKCILLVSQNNLFFIIAYLGILKSGNICIPLSPTIEQESLEFIIRTTNPALGFISDLAKKKLAITLACFSETDLSSVEPDQQIKKGDNNDFDGSQIGEIIFTSGSTAQPKGVMLTHNNIIANTDSIIQYLHLEENDKMMVVLPFFYCYGLSLLHTHIRVGGQLFLNNNFIFLASTIKNLNDFQCTGFAGVPSHFQILLRKTDLFKNTEFPFLRYVTQAGGKLPNAYIMEFTEAFSSIAFFVMYGQTEATARLSYLPPDLVKEKMGSIGRGIPGVELRVVNNKGKGVQPGKTGEIIARGKNIMLGYYGDPKESAKTIRNGWLYTGDLATIDQDGFIFLTARKKEIIKVGGKRISPKEIEEIISLIPGVIDCTVRAVEDEILGEAIKATIVIADGANPINEETIRAFCATKLSSYKIPTHIEIKRELSMSATGKKTFAK